MNEVAHGVISSELAAVGRETDVPAPPYGYGRDLACVGDLSPDLEEVDPMSPRAIAEAILRRFDCPRGALVDDPDYGFDLSGELNRGQRRSDAIAIGGLIRAEAEKDDRVDSVSVESTLSADSSELSATLIVTPIDPRVGGFSMVLAATSAGVVLEAMAAG